MPCSSFTLSLFVFFDLIITDRTGPNLLFSETILGNGVPSIMTEQIFHCEVCDCDVRGKAKRLKTKKHLENLNGKSEEDDSRKNVANVILGSLHMSLEMKIGLVINASTTIENRKKKRKAIF